jgi:hypothetical protein
MLHLPVVNKFVACRLKEVDRLTTKIGGPLDDERRWAACRMPKVCNRNIKTGFGHALLCAERVENPWRRRVG